MNVLRIALWICVFIFCGLPSIKAQITFTNAPSHKSFLPQDKTIGGCQYSLEGKVTDLSYTRLYVTIYKDGVLYRSYGTQLQHLGLYKYFTLPVFLPTEKAFYKLEYQFTGAKQYTTEVDSILVGDAYLVQGQSNAVAADYRNNSATAFDTSYISPYLRSFGSSSYNASIAQQDIGWHPMEASKAYTQGAVGQWAAVMAKTLLDSFDTPICILNGAVGGTPVNYHLPYTPNHFNTNTNYGRLLTRVENAKLRNNITGIFYFQGESDGSLAVKHDTMFREIVTTWEKDFPRFKKLYVIQVRSGCGGPSLALREVQRQFGLSINNCQTVSANGLNGHDGCHYNFKDGYESLGWQLAALVGRDFYDSNAENVDPPDVKKATYHNADHTEIKITMQRPEDILYGDAGFKKLFGVSGDPLVQISSAKIVNNELIIKLNKSSCNELRLFYNGDRYTQPWVKNSTGMGLLTFDGLLIEPHAIKEAYHLCKNQPGDIGEDSISGYTYLWTNTQTYDQSTSAKYNLRSDTTTNLRLVISYSSTLCRVSDTLSIQVTVDAINIPFFQSSYTICKGDSLSLSPVFNNYSSFKWNGQNEKVFKTDSSTWVNWVGTSIAGCIYTDSFQVLESTLRLPTFDTMDLCSNQDTLLQLDKSFFNYYWGGAEGTDTFRLTAGQIQALVVDSFGCMDSTLFLLKYHPKPFNPLWEYSACKGVETQIVKPDKVVSWSTPTYTLPDSFILRQEYLQEIRWTDTFGCNQMDSLKRIDNPLPYFESPSDTGFCGSESYYWDSKDTTNTYLWEDSVINKSSRTFTNSGTYKAVVISSEGCIDSAEFTLSKWEIPNLEIFKDTALCKDSTWLLELRDSWTYWINNELTADQVKLKADNQYTIRAESNQSCTSEVLINIGIKDCFVGIQNTKLGSILVFPNPVQNQLNIQTNLKYSYYEIIDLNRKLLQSGPMQSQIDVSILSPGLYYLRVQNKDAVGKTLFMKQ